MKEHQFCIGDVVLSKMGRDKKNHFAVVGIENEYVFIADGKKHLLSSPKKKNVKHLQFVNATLDVIAEKINKGAKVFDSELNSALRQFNEPSENN